MFATVPQCTETISIWWAMIFGADGACVRIGLWSVLQVIVPLGIGIFTLQYMVKRLLFGRRRNGVAEGVSYRPKTGQIMSQHKRELPGD